ncbi:hypothetical protein [Paraburkholderia kururiensis]|uniref:hypothetical protein n=1 Tax=Paraburkholderia kururiensis TaxID=984307 RepID=UPI0005A84776|nr:hypothetical protein [Paraburkholderia kururiensis]
MDDKELKATLANLYAEIDMLRARSDVLAIALKRAIVNSPDPVRVLNAITASLDVSSVKALYSTMPTEAYLESFGAAVSLISKWHEAPPRAVK